MKDAIEILEEEASRVGWNEASMLSLACEYIDNQKDNAAFKEFVKRQAAEEMESSGGS